MGRKGKLRISFVSPSLALSLPPRTSFTLRAGIWKGEGSSGGRRKTSSTCAHKEICSALSGGPSFSVSVNNERGLLFKWMWQSPQWTIRALSPPHRRRHHHWTTLDCLEAMWNKGSAPLCCGGPACGLCAPSGANIWWNRRVRLCSSDAVALLLVEMFVIHMIRCSERKKLHKIKAKKKITFFLSWSAARRGFCTMVAGSAAGRFLSMLSAQHTCCFLWRWQPALCFSGMNKHHEAAGFV